MSEPTSYHPSNVKLVADNTGYSEESIIAIAEHAESLGIMVRIDGIPFGAFNSPSKLQTEVCES